MVGCCDARLNLPDDGCDRCEGGHEKNAPFVIRRVQIHGVRRLHFNHVGGRRHCERRVASIKNCGRSVGAGKRRRRWHGRTR